MHGIEKRYVFLFPTPQVSAWGPCFHSVDFPPGGASRLTASTGGFSPIQVPWVPVYLVSWALSLGAISLRHVQVVAAYLCPSCSSHPSPAWFSSKTSASWVLTVASAPDSERAFAFGRSLCSVSSSASSPSTLVASWCGG